MWISKKKYEEKLQRVYNEGLLCGIQTIICGRPALMKIILKHLEELSKNTWDQDRIETIKKLLEG